LISTIEFTNVTSFAEHETYKILGKPKLVIEISNDPTNPV